MPLSDDETPSSSEQVISTNGQSADVPTSASNVSESSPATQTATPQTTRTDSNKKSIKKWILIGAAAAAAITAILLIKKSEPEPQVSIGTPSVGAPE